MSDLQTQLDEAQATITKMVLFTIPVLQEQLNDARASTRIVSQQLNDSELRRMALRQQLDAMIPVNVVLSMEETLDSHAEVFVEIEDEDGKSLRIKDAPVQPTNPNYRHISLWASPAQIDRVMDPDPHGLMGPAHD